jgi:Rps23 Pro-64 3,4-dihydroxylase Tpa1-like proline 4-hydroxylase
MVSFPSADWDGWNELGDSYQKEKYACRDIEVIPQPFRDLLVELCEPRFLDFLERVTGIDKLIPDPYFEGGGLHLSGPRGHLSMHTDFHTYSRLDLYRRINVLVYLNPDWSEADGGALHLHGDDDADVTVVPRFGTCVVFETNDRSVHGFPEPIADGRWRRSLALYYYTSTEAPEFSGDATTHWREHGDQRGVRRVRLACYRALMRVSRAFSIVAHVVNPNQGLALVKTRLAQRNRPKRD